MSIQTEFSSTYFLLLLAKLFHAQVQSCLYVLQAQPTLAIVFHGYLSQLRHSNLEVLELWVYRLRVTVQEVR